MLDFAQDCTKEYTGEIDVRGWWYIKYLHLVDHQISWSSPFGPQR